MPLHHPNRRTGNTTAIVLVCLGVVVLAGVGVWFFIQIEASRQWAQKEGARADFKEESARRARQEVESLKVQLQAEVEARKKAEKEVADLRRQLEEAKGRQPPDIDQAQQALRAGKEFEKLWVQFAN